MRRTVHAHIPWPVALFVGAIGAILLFAAAVVVIAGAAFVLAVSLLYMLGEKLVALLRREP